MPKHFGTQFHGLSQDLETGCPKLAIVKFLGLQIFEGDHNHKHVQIHENKVGYHILKQCSVNYMQMKYINYMLEIDILRNSSPKIMGVLRGAFSVWVFKKTPRRPAG